MGFIVIGWGSWILLGPIAVPMVAGFRRAVGESVVVRFWVNLSVADQRGCSWQFAGKR